MVANPTIKPDVYAVNEDDVKSLIKAITSNRKHFDGKLLIK